MLLNERGVKQNRIRGAARQIKLQREREREEAKDSWWEDGHLFIGDKTPPALLLHKPQSKVTYSVWLYVFVLQFLSFSLPHSSFCLNLSLFFIFLFPIIPSAMLHKLHHFLQPIFILSYLGNTHTHTVGRRITVMEEAVDRKGLYLPNFDWLIVSQFLSNYLVWLSTAQRPQSP